MAIVRHPPSSQPSAERSEPPPVDRGQPAGRRPGARWWVSRIAAAVVLGLTLAGAIDFARGGVTATWLRYGGAVVHVGQGERIEIRPGRSLYLDCRGSGSPTLILEAGMGADSATWSPIHDELSTITRTCSYDRTGRGRSDGGSAGDLAGMSDELSALLAAAGESPPYVVVGHSLGSVIGRVHASRAVGSPASSLSTASTPTSSTGGSWPSSARSGTSIWVTPRGCGTSSHRWRGSTSNGAGPSWRTRISWVFRWKS